MLSWRDALMLWIRVGWPVPFIERFASKAAAPALPVLLRCREPERRPAGGFAAGLPLVAPLSLPARLVFELFKLVRMLGSLSMLTKLLGWLATEENGLGAVPSDPSVLCSDHVGLLLSSALGSSDTTACRVEDARQYLSQVAEC